MAETTCPDCKSERDKITDCKRCGGYGTVPIELEPDYYGLGKGRFFVGDRSAPRRSADPVRNYGRRSARSPRS
jgi:hypothetical protein